MSSCCCSQNDPPEPDPAQEENHDSCCGGHKKGKDWVLWSSLILCSICYGLHLFLGNSLPDQLAHFSQGVFELLNKMWWGLALGIIAVGALGKVPREWVASILGKPGSLQGILRAMSAGLILDLCNHGILLIAMKLYERGASLGQTLTFLIASPWNSLSLTLILVALIGLKWTLLFILLSAVIAIITGLCTEFLVKKGRLPANPNAVELPDDFKLLDEMRQFHKQSKWSLNSALGIIKTGFAESGMIVRWILLGTLMAACVRSFVPQEIFGEWFGPTWLGVMLTLVAATVIEVCSEGSSPIAADLVTRASAPGNGFAFLMAGAATDYTEIMALKETTKSWKTTFILPLLTLPQVVVIAWIINTWAN